MAAARPLVLSDHHTVVFRVRKGPVMVHTSAAEALVASSTGADARGVAKQLQSHEERPAHTRSGQPRTHP